MALKHSFPQQKQEAIQLTYKEKREKFDERLHEHLTSLSPSESYASVLRMALKKSLALDILHSFRIFKYKSAKPGQYPAPPDSVADEAFRGFLKLPKKKIETRILAYEVFQLETFGDRYDKKIEQLATEGSYTASCRAALCLKRFHFPFETFCLPLLRQGRNMSTGVVGRYLKKSPENQVKLVELLNGLRYVDDDVLSNDYKLTRKKLRMMITDYVSS